MNKMPQAKAERIIFVGGGVKRKNAFLQKEVCFTRF